MPDELGFHAAFTYKETPPDQALRQAAPDGIDIYFDNVGGDHVGKMVVRVGPDPAYAAGVQREAQRSPQP